MDLVVVVLLIYGFFRIYQAICKQAKQLDQVIKHQDTLAMEILVTRKEITKIREYLLDSSKQR